MIRPIHPFPARMAPELALEYLQELAVGSIVLDPMAGSGTVLRHASELGHEAVGFDLDPLAVLISRVWSTPVDDATVDGLATRLLDEAECLSAGDLALPWIDEDEETASFIHYWFGEPQRDALRRLAFVLHNADVVDEEQAALDVLRVALSRIIVTKEQGASLARDVSHSRPHRVAESSEFEVIPAFRRSLKLVRGRLEKTPPKGGVTIQLGDARELCLEDASVDAVLTSPPYLNAIDYLRGHRLALVWLGLSFPKLRSIRSSSIGAERARDQAVTAAPDCVKEAMGDISSLPSRYQNMIDRYAADVYKMVGEAARTLKIGGQATFVVGNSCLKGAFIRNSDAVLEAAKLHGLEDKGSIERDLPIGSRYLPTPEDGALGKRMRTETILRFVRPLGSA